MGELVAEAFLSAVFQTLIERLTSPGIVNFFWGEKSIDDQLKDLNEKLNKANGLLNDAENRQLDEPDVKEWLDEIRDVIYRAQDLMEDIDRSKEERESETDPSFLMKMMSKVIPSTSEFEKTVQGEFTNKKIVVDKLFLYIFRNSELS